MKNSIKRLGYTHEWLLGEVQKQGATRIDDVFLAQIDSKEMFMLIYTRIISNENRKTALINGFNIKKTSS